MEAECAKSARLRSTHTVVVVKIKPKISGNWFYPQQRFFLSCHRRRKCDFQLHEFWLNFPDCMKIFQTHAHKRWAFCFNFLIFQCNASSTSPNVLRLHYWNVITFISLLCASGAQLRSCLARAHETNLIIAFMEWRWKFSHRLVDTHTFSIHYLNKLLLYI